MPAPQTLKQPDSSAPAETVSVAINGASCEIDLLPEDAARVRGGLTHPLGAATIAEPQEPTLPL
ncbi:hypothetical protein ACIQU6_38600 [Streptomyces sp. NPDC090442]|uniref:hypothetical protein n=1 Tax=Streptomyces sp. NPDC090442 TaxID=3365962 RepID=UPI0038285E8C